MAEHSEAINAAKRAAGYHAADMVEDGMVLGMGTGSTVFYMMERLSGRIRDGLSVSGVPTSYQTAIRARENNIPLTTLDDNPMLDLAIDGADQVDPARCLIKGRGAAHTREKCVAAAAFQLIVVVDEAKIVKRLSGMVPIECIPFAATPVMNQLRSFGGVPRLRDGTKKDGPVITDNGNFIVDCRFDEIDNPTELEALIAMVPGVVESGLFTGFTDKTTVIVGNEKKCRVIT
ncbi:MAG: ribose 5-phosphate isomerase A [Methanoregula sp.]|nr:ribose 5-phosphate isomerase A [Methanoregula sp.]